MSEGLSVSRADAGAGGGVPVHDPASGGTGSVSFCTPPCCSRPAVRRAIDSPNIGDCELASWSGSDASFEAAGRRLCTPGEPWNSLGPDHSKRRERDRSIGETRIHSVMPPIEELLLRQRLEKQRAGLLIEPPQTLRLRTRELQARHLEVLTADAVQDLF